ncbi:MAG: S41 family peptidase [Gemmatimonadaceae bacterium]
MRASLVLLAAALAANVTPLAAQTRLLRQPTVSGSHVAFAYANNVWIASREGGDARRLTSFQGVTANPKFSPDGSMIAFSGQYGGNTDVYVVAAEGGEPRRLTWHPGSDIVQGWTPDGKRVIFASGRVSPNGAPKFWSVSLESDLPTPLVMPRAWQGKASPDGKRFAYRMANSWDDEWRNYRGGQNRPIWIFDLATHEVETPPWQDSKDIEPVWIGETVFFLSDRDWAMNVWSYDTKSRKLEQVTHFADYDVKSMDAGGGAVVFEQGGDLHLLDPATKRHRRLDITVKGDFPWLVPQWKDVANRITNIALSPTGKRAIVEARGDIFTIPAEKGDWRNITRTTGVAERAPAWSADGKWISYFSDAGGEYKLVIESQDGIGAAREIALPNPSFYYTPVWSPDAAKMLFTDAHLNLWVLDIASGAPKKIDTDLFMVPDRSINAQWSPDSRWIAYSRRLNSLLRAIFVYDVQAGKAVQLTDGLSDATWPAWDASGKYLYFLASTNFALNTGWLDMTSYERPVTRAVYLAVLKKDELSPLLPESDEEGARSEARDTTARSTAAGAAPGDSAKADAPNTRRARTPPVLIDFAGLSQRILSLGVTPRDYSQLRAGPAGTIFFIESVPLTGPAEPQPGSGGGVLHRYQLKERKAAQFIQGVQQYVVSSDGKQLLYRTPGQQPALSMVDTDKQAPAAGAGRLTTNLRALVDPRAEFKQMFTEGWRNQREYLYVSNLHGADYVKTKAMYEPMLSHVAHRADLSYLLDMLGAEIAVGHSFVSGGDVPEVPQSNVGLLGADFTLDNGRYRITKIYTGENWNPELRAPLTGPGIDVRTLDYIIAIDGLELRATDNIYQRMEGTANRQTVLHVNARPTMEGARRAVVVPLANDQGLRNRDWIEANRRKVDSMSNGRLAYVYLPNTGPGGYTAFNRYYFAQQHKEGAILDERWNGGGSAADYIIEVLQRDFDGYFNNRVADKRPFTNPIAGIWGPKVMIVNEMAGSGGDLMPYMFKRRKIGPLVGKRTWGGLVGTWDTPQLIDGGSMIAPRGGFFDREGKWAVENEGTTPDIDVENWPKDVIAGRDPQLERAVEEALKMLQANPVRLMPEPPAPIRSRRPAAKTIPTP